MLHSRAAFATAGQPSLLKGPSSSTVMPVVQINSVLRKFTRFCMLVMLQKTLSRPSPSQVTLLIISWSLHHRSGLASIHSYSFNPVKAYPWVCKRNSKRRHLPNQRRDALRPPRLPRCRRHNKWLGRVPLGFDRRKRLVGVSADFVEHLGKRPSMPTRISQRQSLQDVIPEAEVWTVQGPRQLINSRQWKSE